MYSNRALKESFFLFFQSDWGLLVHSSVIAARLPKSCPVWPTLPPAIRGTPATHSGTQEFHHCLIFRFLLKKPRFTAEKKQEATQKQHISELSLLNSVKPSATYFYLFPFILTLAVLWGFSLSLSTQLKVLMLLALSGSSLYKSSFSYTPYNSSPLSGVTLNSLHPGQAG